MSPTFYVFKGACMTNFSQIMDEEKKIIAKRITELYQDCQSKVDNLMLCSEKDCIVDQIEGLVNNLQNELSLLENNYKLLVIKSALKHNNS
jgi:hypothetical protein